MAAYFRLIKVESLEFALQERMIVQNGSLGCQDGSRPVRAPWVIFHPLVTRLRKAEYDRCKPR